MNKYLITVYQRFEKNPTAEEFKDICDDIVDTVDRMCDDAQRSFHVTFPLQSEIDKGHFYYRISIIVSTDKTLRSVELFEAIDNKHQIDSVTLQEKRFAKRADENNIYWFHEGETTYYDGSTYISPNYDLYINGQSHYTVQYVPVAIKNMWEQDKKRYEGISYMWRCTGCWDNFMKATTLDDALKEFEAYYHKMLWKAIEGTRQRLIEAEDAFRDFIDYQWRTR